MSEQLRSIEVGLVEDIYVDYPEATLELMDDITKDIYLPLRGPEGIETERAIICAPEHVPHRENDIEHSGHLTLVATQLWRQRQRLGIEFPLTFNPYRTVELIASHEIPEIIAGDVCSMEQNVVVKALKARRERAAADIMRLKRPHLGPMIDDWEEYEAKETIEARFAHDIDKLCPILVICATGGERWHDWEGKPTTREFMCDKVRPTIITQFGKTMFKQIEHKLDKHPQYFPA